MNIREYIQKINNEKQQLIDEIKTLKAENEELKMINSKLVDDYNSSIYKAIEEVKPEVVEVPEKENPSDDENVSKPISEEAEEVVEEEQKPKRSRKRKDTEDSVINLM